MKKHLLKLSFLIVTASMFCACDSFLDKQPSATSDAPITEVSQLLSLYDYVTNTYEYDYPGVYATDDYGVPLALYDASPITFGADQMSLYALSSEVMETTTGNNVCQYDHCLCWFCKRFAGRKRRGVVQCLFDARLVVFPLGYRPLSAIQ